MAFDYDLFVIGGGSGGVRAARVAAATGAKVASGRGIPHGRHLRDPGLRAQKADGLCIRLFRKCRRCPRLWLGRAGRAV